MAHAEGTRQRESKIRVVNLTHTHMLGESQNCLYYVVFSYYKWEDKTNTKLDLQNLKRTDQLGELNEDGKILTFILQKRCVRMTAF
jgi:hypothetical protein